MGHPEGCRDEPKHRAESHQRRVRGPCNGALEDQKGRHDRQPEAEERSEFQGCFHMFSSVRKSVAGAAACGAGTRRCCARLSPT